MVIRRLLRRVGDRKMIGNKYSQAFARSAFRASASQSALIFPAIFFRRRWSRERTLSQLIKRHIDRWTVNGTKNGRVAVTAANCGAIISGSRLRFARVGDRRGAIRHGYGDIGTRSFHPDARPSWKGIGINRRQVERVQVVRNSAVGWRCTSQFVVFSHNPLIIPASSPRYVARSEA